MKGKVIRVRWREGKENRWVEHVKNGDVAQDVSVNFSWRERSDLITEKKLSTKEGYWLEITRFYATSIYLSDCLRPCLPLSLYLFVYVSFSLWQFKLTFIPRRGFILRNSWFITLTFDISTILNKEEYLSFDMDPYFRIWNWFLHVQYRLFPHLWEIMYSTLSGLQIS